jgi:hypothetical protein
MVEIYSYQPAQNNTWFIITIGSNQLILRNPDLIFKYELFDVVLFAN